MGQELVYSHNGTRCIGRLYAEGATKRPCILVAHAWMGQDDFARDKAKRLTELGYCGFAVDLYGDAKCADNAAQASELMTPLVLDRALLQGRMLAAYEAVKNHPQVDSTKMGAMGFCFGGLATLELFRAGAPLKAAVTFHAVLGDMPLPLQPGITGSLLMLHGHDDPLVAQDNIRSLQTELTLASIDWQMHIYGNTSHAFTNPHANDKSSGLLYNAKADARSWQAMQNFFTERLG